MREVGAKTGTEMRIFFNEQKRETIIRNILTEEKVILRVERNNYTRYVASYITDIEIIRSEVIFHLEKPHSPDEIAWLVLKKEKGEIYYTMEGDKVDSVRIL